MVLDHKDRNPLNNVLTNLRVVPQSFNVVNVDRKKGEYYQGVQKTKSGSFTANYCSKHLGTFKTEHLAKVARILVARKKGPMWEELETDVEMSDSDIQEARRVMQGKKNIAKKGSGCVSKHYEGLWSAAYGSVRIGYFKTEEAAHAAVREAKADRERKDKEEKESLVIPRTAEGHAFLTAKGGQQVLVDDDMFMLMYKNMISVNKRGYAVFKYTHLHRTVITEPYNTRKFCIDHRNQDKLDNRRGNLHIVPYGVNSSNCTKGPASKFPGVEACKNGTFKGIVLDRKVTPRKQYAKRCKTAKAASIWRNAKDREINPEKYA